MYSCGFSNESVNCPLNVRDSAKEEKSLEVQNGRLSRNLAKVCAMRIWLTNCRECRFACVHDADVATLGVLHDEEKACSKLY